MDKEPVNTQFTMDPNLLVSVIKSQAGTLSKALLEGVMNSLDAGASSVNLTLNQTDFTIWDDGKGFSSAEDIENWFGRFGTPHKEGDAQFGKFRMGRGQLMAFAATRWLSNEFCMDVDIEKKGLSYDFSKTEQRVRGCRIEGLLYTPLASYELKDLLTELKKFVAFAPRPVYVNEELFGANPARLKTWTFENDDAYFKVVQGSSELLVYNQGIYVQSLSTWKTGIGGTVVSKKPLEVNFARNAILESKCETWGSIQKVTEQLVVAKLTAARSLEDNERRYLARRVLNATAAFVGSIAKAKILTDPSGKHSTLDTLGFFDKFVHIRESGPLACAVHGTNRTFVVTDLLLERFGLYSVEDFVRELRSLGGVLDYNAVVIDASEVSAQGLGGTTTLEFSDLTPRLRAGFQTLAWLNTRIAERLRAAGYNSDHRELLPGSHKRNKFIAWTDGKSYVTVNRHYIKRLETGLDGALFWAQTLIHEYMHDTDDSESHDHGVVFFQKFHDAINSDAPLALGTLTQETVLVYLKALQENGIGRPRLLTGQLRPAFL